MTENHRKKIFSQSIQNFYGKIKKGMEKADGLHAAKAWLWATLVSVLSLAFVMLPFLFRRSYTVWAGLSGDGATQFITFFERMKEVGWLKAVGNYDFYIGLGGDYLTSFSFYSLFDPFNCILFALPFNPLLNYTITMALKQLACALTMFAYLRYKKVRNSRAIMLSVAYMLSGFVAFTFVRHYNLAVAPIYLPLAIMGVDKLFNKERPFVFIASLFFCMVSNFYVFFSLSVFVVAYAIAYYFHDNALKGEKSTVKGFFAKLVPIGAYYLLAVVLAGVVLLPNLYGYMHAARNGSKGVVLFDFQMFLTQGASLVVPMTGKNYSVVSVNLANAVLVLYALFKRDKKTHMHGIFVLVLTVGYLLPVFGYAMNIFNYSNNRWSYGLNFFIYVMIALQSTDGDESVYDDCAAKKINACFVIYIAVLIASALPAVITIFEWKTWWLYTLSVLIAGGAGYGAYRLVKLIKNKGVPVFFKKLYQPTLLFVLGFALTIGYCFSYYVIYSGQHKGKARYATLFTEEESYAAEKSETEYFRTDTMATGVWYDNFGTRGMNNGYYGTTLYNTIADSGVYEFLKENGVYNPAQNLGMGGLDSRSALQTLLSVRYTYDVLGQPYGFTKIDGYDCLYENGNYVPFGFMVNKTYSREKYLTLDVLERQNMLLSGVVLDIEKGNADDTYQPTLQKQELSKGTFADIALIQSVGKKKPKSFAVDASTYRGQEVYLVIKGVRDVGRNTALEISCNGVQKQYYYAPKGNLMYSDQRDIYMNFGVVGNEVESLDFKLWVSEGSPVVNFDCVEIHSMPVAAREDSLVTLSQTAHLKDVELSDGGLKGSIQNGEDGYLLLTLPYSDGWTAYIDGEETEIYQADTAFMAIRVEGKAQKQTIELCYETPYLAEGKAVSYLGLGGLGCVILADTTVRLVRKRKKTEKGE
ncbi:MAG: YfhO family protein [Clostridia bacterium]|nr:YfhO family protein [Clostridia bacterium]